MSAETQAVDKVLRQTEVLTAAGTALGSLEYLCSPEEFDDDRLLSWTIGRTRYKLASRPGTEWLDKIFKRPNLMILIGLRLAASAVLLTPGADRRTRAAAIWYLALTNWLLNYRNNLGSDGTEHMNVQLCAALAASTLFPNDVKAREACTWYLAGQSSLSYFASGLAKATSPYWRDGTALTGVMRTRTYGDQKVYALLKRFPVLSKLGGLSVVAGEVGFPLALVAPRPVSRAILGTGLAFHAGNAVFMGLNRFVWAFAATYPSVVHVAERLAGRR